MGARNAYPTSMRTIESSSRTFSPVIKPPWGKAPFSSKRTMLKKSEKPMERRELSRTVATSFSVKPGTRPKYLAGMEMDWGTAAPSKCKACMDVKACLIYVLTGSHCSYGLHRSRIDCPQQL